MRAKCTGKCSVNTPIFVRLHVILFAPSGAYDVNTVANQLCRGCSGHLAPTSPPALFLSFSAVLLYVVLVLPPARLRRPSDIHVIAVLQPSSYPFVIMRPMNFHLLLLTSSLSFSILAISITCLLVILSCRCILSIRLRHLFWKTSMLFSSHFLHLPCLATMHQDWFNQSLI